VRLRAQAGDLRLRHALAQGLEDRRGGRARDLVGAAHERDSCASLITRQPAVTGVALTTLPGQGGARSRRERERHRLLDADAARGLAVAQDGRHERDGLSCSSHARTSGPIWICSRRARLLEGGRDPGRIALGA
jgi:hypothetical protein